MKKLSETLRMLIEGEFSGYIKINFTQGSIGRVEKYEEFDDADIVRTADKNNKKIPEKELQ